MNIKLIIIGHSNKIINFKQVKSHKSNYFKYTSLETISDLPKSTYETSYLDIVYTKNDIHSLLKNITFDGVCIAIMNYSFDDNFYLHRIDSNKICISVKGINEILSKDDISLENFIIKNTYEIFLLHNVLNNLTSEEVYNFVHHDTRSCLFDLNGDKNDIVYNTEQPNLCNECISKIQKYPIPDTLLKNIQNELKSIKKPFFKRVELFIRKYPLFSILLTIVLSTCINLFSNYIWEFILKS